MNMAKEYVITEGQLRRIVESMKTETNEGSDGNYMAKQQLFTIAMAAFKMWESLEEGEELEDWMSSKIAQAEQSVVSAFKAYMYDEFEEKNNRDM
jgi:hypothetical protein